MYKVYPKNRKLSKIGKYRVERKNWTRIENVNHDNITMADITARKRTPKIDSKKDTTNSNEHYLVP